MGKSEEDLSKAENPGAPIRRDVSRAALGKPSHLHNTESQGDVLEFARIWRGRGREEDSGWVTS